MSEHSASRDPGLHPKHRLQELLDKFRHRLAHLDALPQLTILGFICGLAAAGVIIAFRLSIDLPLQFFLQGDSEDFESLAAYWHFALPVLGAVALGVLLHYTPASQRQVSVGHVLDRLHNHQGKLPARNWIVQFFGGILALVSGQSMGREGPAVHLGAGIASQLGQWLRLPNNCLRTLIGCGVASAIAASFNTPMAGVIFSMEVILMEYTIAGFIPVMMASVTGAVIGRMMFGAEPAFSVGPVQLQDLWSLPIIALAGLVIAFFAAAFIRLQLFFNRQQHYPVFSRMLVAGVATGAIALLYPEILGIGYDTIDAAMHGELALHMLLGILFAKLIATALSGGLGVPGGVIGPLLFIGGLLGGAIALVTNLLIPGDTANPSFYVLLGMGAMMAAALNAPLTALITVFELTHNPYTIFPTMLMIVVTVLTTRQLFRCDGLFIAQLEANGFNLNHGPVRQALNRVGVRSMMETQFIRSNNRITLTQLRQRLQQHPTWLVIDEPEHDKYLLAAADISAFVDNCDPEQAEEIKLLDIPGRKWLLKPIHQQASLYEAQLELNQYKADALYVERENAPWLSPVMGVITQEHISNFYRV
ncbi:chloride channel protein [Aestuariicella hydrocarbonica]|uniref:Chloride channel protein n=1 Tax=Pseudomaricurvus hydrocarbonicus TaxID=1470433 RepID=A0A9E5MQ03_9GAMM|nr:chloride channel protein [Aestuariicella hydrocarbonica]NHO68187.1 chloride channel protein [Aestuariicella hydrocarbonica]